jgi:hypothetical protein
METYWSKFKLWLSRVRTVSAWIVIPAFLSMFIAHQVLKSKYRVMYPDWIEQPAGMKLILMWRNYSLLAVVATSLISLPRWQSIVGLISTALFLYLWGSY